VDWDPAGTRYRFPGSDHEGKDPTLDVRLQSSLAELINQLGNSYENGRLSEVSGNLDYKETPDDPPDGLREVLILPVWALIYLMASRRISSC
jgi:hypothetical protein